MDKRGKIEIIIDMLEVIHISNSKGLNLTRIMRKSNTTAQALGKYLNIFLKEGYLNSFKSKDYRTTTHYVLSEKGIGLYNKLKVVREVQNILRI